MGAEKDNKYAEKYTLEDAEKIFNEILKLSIESEDVLCIQEAVIKSGIPRSTFYALCKKHKVLDNIKKEINDAIISKINRQALTSKYNPTASIWRMKQLGEKDKQEIQSSGTLDIKTINFKKFKNE